MRQKRAHFSLHDLEKVTRVAREPRGPSIHREQFWVPGLQSSLIIGRRFEVVEARNLYKFPERSCTNDMAKLSDYDCIGFDLDHTLIQYKLDNLYPVSVMAR